MNAEQSGTHQDFGGSLLRTDDGQHWKVSPLLLRKTA